MTRISMIACVDEDNAIGYKNKLLFYNKYDMEWFKQHTFGKPVIMGRKTYESIGKPLPYRRNVILTRRKDYSPHKYVDIFHDIESVLHSCRRDREIVIIGGSEIYNLFMYITDRLYLTKVEHSFPQADSYFPEINEDQWNKVYRRRGKKSSSEYRYSFNIYDKLK